MEDIMDYPVQQSSKVKNDNNDMVYFDMREYLYPKRLTMIMWDYAFLTRRMKGDSFESYDEVLDQAVENGYNTIRIDPLPHAIDLMNPDKLITRPQLFNQMIHPWDRAMSFEGEMGKWLVEFMQKLNERNLNYCLSGWFPPYDGYPRPKNLQETVPMWIKMLRDWEELFGFENLIYVDLSNEYPYFLDNHLENSIIKHGQRWSDSWNKFIKNEVDSCLRQLRNEFPQLRFTVSLHGDTNWIDLGLELDVMDIHFYADADARFNDRTNFDINCADFFRDESLFKDFSDRCVKSHNAMAPMYRARQRAKLSAFANWSNVSGIPLVTTESWASWYYIDHKDLDWSWILDWSKWSLEDAIDYKMWGWTPHNYCQPQFANWMDTSWHKELTNQFLKRNSRDNKL